MPEQLSPSDRVLILAPHPDDESLATGGLILQALARGAKVHIIFATNGDNNPWPQRWVERRWRIGPDEQQRWGAQRQQEARRAVAYLGLPEGAASFLNLPDQGTPRLLHRRDEATLQRMTAEIAAFRPTLCAIPSPYDLHRDHNALHLLWQIAEHRAALSETPRQLHYLVHFRRDEPAPPPVCLHLSEADRQKKHDAILCHETQMVLSRKRFLAYAAMDERYHAPLPVCDEAPGHRIYLARWLPPLLRLRAHLPRRRIGATIQLNGETEDNMGLRWIAPIPLASGRVTPQESSHPGMERAVVRIEGDEAEIAIPIPRDLRLLRLYAKFQRPTFFLDETGWRSVPVISTGAWGSAAGAPA